jgi:hypothetical protein
VPLDLYVDLHKRRTGGACPIGTSGRREGGWNLRRLVQLFRFRI